MIEITVFMSPFIPNYILSFNNNLFNDDSFNDVLLSINPLNLENHLKVNITFLNEIILHKNNILF